jgi:hypothetical protein
MPSYDYYSYYDYYRYCYPCSSYVPSTHYHYSDSTNYTYETPSDSLTYPCRRSHRRSRRSSSSSRSRSSGYRLWIYV